jgi:hypothetical protein
MSELGRRVLGKGASLVTICCKPITNNDRTSNATAKPLATQERCSTLFGAILVWGWGGGRREDPAAALFPRHLISHPPPWNRWWRSWSQSQPLSPRAAIDTYLLARAERKRKKVIEGSRDDMDARRGRRLANRTPKGAHHKIS